MFSEQNSSKACICCKQETLNIVAHLVRTKHKKHIGGVSISFKITNFFVKPDSKGDEVHAAEGTLAFQCEKHHNISSSTDSTNNSKRKISLL